jgi:N-acetylmuramic acid 6-phosphate etherase
MSTEQINTRFADLETWPSLELVKAFHDDQLAAVAAVSPALPAIAEAADAAAARLADCGRLIYVGAGTSGRIGVQDGVELTPTFNWPKERLLFILAGGDDAVLQAIEGAEDSVEEGQWTVLKSGVNENDVVIGLAASGATPFTVAAVEYAGLLGAMTIGVANNRDAPLLAACKHPILIETGAEAIAGSTRMKAGTAQKVFCNLFSTLLMVRLGRVYRGLMVDLRASNEKLRRRSAQIVTELTDCDPAEAQAAVEQAEGEVKLAVMIASGFGAARAQDLLHAHGGDLRAALADGALRLDVAS